MSNDQFIPYGKHAIGEEDIEAVVDVLTNQFLTQGEMVPRFEAELARYCQAQYVQTVNSGTSGLHVACLAAGVSKDEIVWTVPNSFVASANCARYCGAEVDFVDIDPSTRNIDIHQLEQKLRRAVAARRLPKALIVVHFAGMSCDMQQISQLTRQYGISLIEDAAHALGGRYQGLPIGNCQYSDMTVLSFHPVKSITTAEGGAVVTNDAALYHALGLYAKHGVSRNEVDMQGPAEGPWYYEQSVLGFNYRLSDLHAALGISQLRKLDQFIEKRARLAELYTEALAGLPLTLPSEQIPGESAWHLYVVELQHHERKDVFTRLVKRGIGVNVHYIPIHLQPYYQALGFARGDFPAAERFYDRALTIPLFPGMTQHQQDNVVKALQEVLA